MTLAIRPSDNANPSMPSVYDAGIRVHTVPLREANAETLRGYATLATAFADAEVEICTWPAPGWRPVDPGTGNQGGTTEGSFEIFRVGNLLYAHNHAVDGHYITGWFDDPAAASETATPADTSRIYVCEANYHPDGGQLFYSRHGVPFVALLALPGDDVGPDDFVAFYCDGRFGLNLHPGVWHQPVYPLANRAVFDNRQGRVHACISCHFVHEFNAYLSVPLRSPY
jgi:ureidoglycolate lyase